MKTEYSQEEINEVMEILARPGTDIPTVLGSTDHDPAKGPPGMAGNLPTFALALHQFEKFMAKVEHNSKRSADKRLKKLRAKAKKRNRR